MSKKLEDYDFVIDRQNAIARELGTIADAVITKFKENPSDEFLKGIAIQLMDIRRAIIGQNIDIAELSDDKNSVEYSQNLEFQARQDAKQVSEMLDSMTPTNENSLSSRFK